MYATASVDEKTNEVIIKLVNIANQSQSIDLNIKGIAKKVSGKVITLADTDLKKFNTITEPSKIVPSENSIAINKGKAIIVLEPNSFKVFRIGKK